MNPENPHETFTAGDVKNASGMSYRQINTWDSKGNLPNQREQATSWRKFSPREIFAIMVCKEIRDRFGTPLESLRYVRNFMLQDGADHLQAAVDIMRYGFSVFILTDLKTTFVMDSDLEFEDLFHMGFLRCSEDQSYVFMQVNHLVNRLRGCLAKPAALHIRDEVYDAVMQARAEPILRNEHELAIIRAIRQGDYKRVILTKKNDSEMLLEVEQDLSGFDTVKDLNAVIAEHDFQTLTVSRHAGKNVRVKRTLPIPLKRKQSKSQINSSDSRAERS
jgi:DNA-binding transcriptional MerR regulator